MSLTHTPALPLPMSTPIPLPLPLPLPLWTLCCDGSAVPNPGRMGLGAVLIGPDGGVAHRISVATTSTGCNNEAEVRALLLALQWLAQHAPAAKTAVQVYSDSSVLVAQLSAGATPPIERLAPLFDAARRALEPFGLVNLQWIARHRNGPADALARAALGLPPKAAVHPGNKHHRKKRR